MISWVLWAMVNAEAAPDQSWPSARMDQSLPGGQASASEASMRVVESAPPSQGPRPLTVFTGPQTMVVDFAPPDQRVPAAVLGPPVTVVAGAQTVVVRQPAASTWVPRAESPVTVVAGPQTVVMQPSRMEQVLPYSSGGTSYSSGGAGYSSGNPSSSAGGVSFGFEPAGRGMVSAGNRFADPPVLASALEKLEAPATSCEGASELARFGDATVISMLLAVAQPVPGDCVWQAMRELGAEAESHRLLAAGEQPTALELMALFPSESHIPLLLDLADSPKETDRIAAWETLSAQIQTQQWVASLLPLLAHSDRAVRSEAIDRLMFREEVAIREALHARRDVEPDPSLKIRLSLVH